MLTACAAPCLSDSDAREIVTNLTHSNATLAESLKLCQDDSMCRASWPGYANHTTIPDYEVVGPIAQDQRASGWTSVSNGLALGRELLVAGNTRRDASTGTAPKRILLVLSDGEQTCVRSGEGATGSWTYADGGRWASGKNSCSNFIGNAGTGDAEAIEQVGDARTPATIRVSKTNLFQN